MLTHPFMTWSVILLQCYYWARPNLTESDLGLKLGFIHSYLNNLWPQMALKNLSIHTSTIILQIEFRLQNTKHRNPLVIKTERTDFQSP